MRRRPTFARNMDGAVFYLELSLLAVFIRTEISSLDISFVSEYNSFTSEGSVMVSSKNSLGVTPRYSQIYRNSDIDGSDFPDEIL